MSKIKLVKQNNSADALLLAFVRILTLITGLLSTSILSHNLNLPDYGTYAAGNLIVSTASILTVMGLVDASNYFYHKEEYCRQYISTIFAIQIVTGIGCACILFLCQDILVRYFKNEQLRSIYVFLLFRPMLLNIGSTLLTLQTVVGRAKAVAAKNIVFSLLKLLAVLLTVFVFHNIQTMFAAFLLLDVLTIAYYKYGFEQAAFTIRIRKVSLKAVPPILKFSLPMGIYLLVNEIMKDIDKFVIAAYENTEQLAIYTNCSNILPLSFVASAFLIIILPIITRLGHAGEYGRAGEIFKTYLQLGYISTMTLTAIAVVLSKEMIQLLYGENYLSGFWVFVIYLFVDMLKFAGVSVVLTTFGKTKFLMVLSIVSMILNVIFNPILYHFYGVIGPALMTLIITTISVIILMTESAKLLRCKPLELLDVKEAVLYFGELTGIGLLMRLLRDYLIYKNMPFYFVLIIVGCLYGGAMLFLQWKPMVRVMKQLNKEKMHRKDFSGEMGNG